MPLSRRGALSTDRAQCGALSRTVAVRPTFPASGASVAARKTPAPDAAYALEDGICEMKRLYVRPPFRGQGLGRDLVLTLIAQARLSLYAKMRLDTIAASMTEAVRLYRSLGFRDIAPYCRNPIPGAAYLELGLG